MRLPLALVSAMLIAFAVGCGGGGGSSTSPAAPAPTATPTAASDPLQLYLVPASDGQDGSPITNPSPGALVANNISIPFTQTGAQQGILVYEPGFSGTFSAAVHNCTLSPNAVTVSPSSSSGSNKAVFVITSTSAGDCAVGFNDGTNAAQVLVDVTTTTGSISATKRN